MTINTSAKLKQLTERQNKYEAALSAAEPPRVAAVEYARSMVAELDAELSRETQHAALVAIIDKAVAAADVTDAAQVFAQFMHAHVTNPTIAGGDGAILLELLGTRRSPIGTTLSKQPGADRALIAALASAAGRVPPGLMRWPQPWHSGLSPSQLTVMAELVAPEVAAEHAAHVTKLHDARVRAQSVIAQLGDSDSEGRAAA